MGLFTKVQKAPPPPPARSVVSPKALFKGDLESKNEVEIQGRLEGTIKTASLLRFVSGCRADGDFQCAALESTGSGKGTLKVEGTATLSETSAFEGELSASALRVRDGARITGLLRKLAK